MRQDESARLDLQHNLWVQAIDGLFTAPIDQNLKNLNVLDLGCGPGSWTFAFAKEHPDAHVLGVDLSPPQSDAHTPPNCSFVKANIEDDWSFAPSEQLFNLIFVRMLALGMHDWSGFFKRCYDHLEPGAWLESQDASLGIFSDNVAIEDSPSLQWAHHLGKGSEALGYNSKLAEPGTKTQYLRTAGFTNITERVDKWPIGDGGWESDKEKQFGMLNLQNVLSIVTGASERVLAASPGLSKETASNLRDEARRELSEPNEKSLYLKL